MSNNINHNFSHGFKEVKDKLNNTLANLSTSQIDRALENMSDTSIPKTILDKARQSLAARHTQSNTKREEIQIVIILMAATKTTNYTYFDLEIKMAQEEVWKRIFNVDESILKSKTQRKTNGNSKYQQKLF